MKTKRILFAVTILSILFTGCGFGKLKDQANTQFGDQHFKTAIALIELYKVRFGEYPASLDSIRYVGDWDKIATMSVSYQKLDTGYELDLVNGWLGKPDTLAYPADFWKGLGLVRSNVKKK
ncbi:MULTISPECIES: hypothetical protein [Niastella]|uniref:Uncharacterized protein n=1 Tax=Niastella soli TaxID=2821487 RepID=A0ABS3YV45_9BACT|nr:hypothetical protein [Niastella soli]MBO9201796.1 hypothetical protein [Niastella soli]